MDIRDTGVGMELARGKPRGGRPAGKAAEGIGIANVRRRLELRYGPAARLTVHSEKGSGTLVRIGLPAESDGKAQP